MVVWEIPKSNGLGRIPGEIDVNEFAQIRFMSEVKIGNDPLAKYVDHSKNLRKLWICCIYQDISFQKHVAAIRTSIKSTCQDSQQFKNLQTVKLLISQAYQPVKLWKS